MPAYRSRTTTHGRNMAGARGLWRATGMKDTDFGKPNIAVVNCRPSVGERWMAKGQRRALRRVRRYAISCYDAPASSQTASLRVAFCLQWRARGASRALTGH